MTKEEFRQQCKAAWEKQHGFVIIDLRSKKHNGNTKFNLQPKTNIIFTLQNGESS